MTKRLSRLPALDPAQMGGFQSRLAKTNLSRQQQRTIMASMRVAANPEAETPEFGFASLPPDRRAIASKSISDTSGVFSAISQNTKVDIEEQNELDEALLNAQIEGKDKIDWSIVLALLAFFIFPAEQTKSLYDAILAAYISAWQLAIREQAAKYGCPYAQAGYPRGASLQEIVRLARRDADSIVNTYNTNAQSALRQLYEANPLGTVNYYLSGMREWATSRQQQKNLTIGIYNVQNGYGLGLQDFVAHNRIETGFRLVGPPPVCPTCMYLMGLGEVDYQTVMSYGFGGIHANCPHRWETTKTYTITCDKMWTG